MDDRLRTFLEQHRAAVMTTLRADGTPHVARVGVGMVDGRLWSSGTQGRVRTRHVRRDPRSTLFVFDPANPAVWAGIEATVTVLDGPEAPEQNLRFFRTLQQGMAGQSQPGHLMWFGEPQSEEDFLRIMAEEQRLIYEFEVTRYYGMFGAP
ncbi:MAG: TIGR03618 family F420-dependent PPOX class oxidoreductase [Dehalococcoidia bacterium]|nr:TIGR03618 family F420-dependent PPOX class oxidoreductase [Dehalococcoidia bacterium]